MPEEQTPVPRPLVVRREAPVVPAGFLQGRPFVFYEALAVDTYPRVWVSDQSEALLGFPAHAFMDTPGLWEARLHPVDRSAVLRAYRSLEPGEMLAVDYRWMTRDGKDLWLRDQAVLVDGKLRGSWLDLSEVKAWERRFLESQPMASVGRLASAFAHDLNNLLTAVLGYAELAGLDALPPETSSNISELVKGSHRASELARFLLLHCRRAKPVIQPLDLGVFLSEHADFFRDCLGSAIELVVVQPSQPFLIQADPRHLELMLVHLAMNAREAMPRGGRWRLEAVPPPSAADEASCSLSRFGGLLVKDTGSGLPQNILDQIQKNSFSALSDGIGAGLVTLKSVIKQAGGLFEVESSPGEGLLYRLWFPLVREVPLADDPSPPPERPSRTTVLLATEDDTLGQLTRRVLAQEGFPVALGAWDGGMTEAGLVIAEINPDSPSAEAYHRQWKSSLTHPRLLLLVEPLDRARWQLAFGLGEDAILTKPFKGEELVRRIRHLLSGG